MTEAQTKLLDFFKKQYDQQMKLQAVQIMTNLHKDVAQMSGLSPSDMGAKYIIEQSNMLAEYLKEDGKVWPEPTEEQAEAMLDKITQEGYSL